MKIVKSNTAFIKAPKTLIKSGGDYIDFTAPDLEGLHHTLSKEIRGKVVLIDLWTFLVRSPVVVGHLPA